MPPGPLGARDRAAVRGICFVSHVLGAEALAPIRSTSRYIVLLLIGEACTPVLPKLVASLKSVVGKGSADPVILQPGGAVRLISGPFVGLEAIYDMAKHEDHAQILPEVLRYCLSAPRRQ